MNSLFGRRTTSAIQPKPQSYRQEKVAVAPKQPPLPSRTASHVGSQQHLRPSQPSRSRSAKSSASPSPAAQSDSDNRSARPRKRKVPEPRFEDDDKDDGKPIDFGGPDKREKAVRPVDYNRTFTTHDSLEALDGEEVSFIHAADTLLEVNNTLQAAAMDDDVVSLELRYPTSSPPERFHLVFLKDQINPAHNIESVVKHVRDVYLNASQKEALGDFEQGISREIRKACNKVQNSLDSIKDNRGIREGNTNKKARVAGDDLKKRETKGIKVSKVDKQLLLELKSAVNSYNAIMDDLSTSGPLARNLEGLHHLPVDFTGFIVKQVYERAVSPKVDILKKRKEAEDGGKDYTYGEIEHEFVSEALTKAGLDSTKVFVDLGSGVGNVVLQAALEFGCESFGCEMVDNCCDLAEAQEKEFAARCCLWGVKPGKTRLVRGSFFENQTALDAVKKADVILVNNEVFSSQTNVRLTQMFLDCKEGCKIVSLKPFVEPEHQITDRNLYNPVNQLTAERHRYSAGFVSWKFDGGDYYISTKDRKRLEAFEKDHP